VRATWVVRGTRQRVMTPGKNRRRTIFGAVDLHSGRFLYQVCRKAVSASFTAFCEQLLAAYPTAPVVAVVCDNVLIHHAKIVQAWLASHPRVRVLHGARYSPHDNPVERIWGALKAYLANSPTPTMAGRLRQVHAFFRQRSPAQLLVTAAPHSSPWLPDRYGQNFREAALERPTQPRQPRSERRRHAVAAANRPFAGITNEVRRPPVEMDLIRLGRSGAWPIL
jgi:transposase